MIDEPLKVIPIAAWLILLRSVTVKHVTERGEDKMTIQDFYGGK